MEEPKKGSRDISDLKARLGLKKGAGQPGVPGPGGPQEAAPAPTAPLPAPPGFPQPQQAAAPAAAPEPPPPDPRRDPFAAAAPSPQAAYYGYGMPLPGTDDGTAPAPLEKPKPWGRIISYLITAAVALGPAYVAGRSCAARENYNLTITQAADVQTEVEKLNKRLNEISDVINKSTEAAKNNPDPELAKSLGAMELKDPDTQKIFHTNYFFMEDLAIDRLFTYYNDTIRLYKLIKDNSKKTEADADQIQNFIANGGTKGAEKNYGVVFDVSGALPLAHFVEIGTPVCATEGKTDCDAKELKGFKYRVDSGGTWSQKEVQRAKLADSVVPLQRTPLFAAVMSGNPDILAVKDHIRRNAEIRAIAGKLQNDQKALLADLKHHAEKPKVFTF